ncbi:hypothetical protein J4H92_00675 [Leucobacter weissii]|uniref:Uncharacterized protein n=1 Tax=Leucobacter weissii TaxID=1983706 RepID=A0A939SAH1_9MICO|nr:hypothetical protein [Leucobacter weissii]MBO1900460.1 hypothetical protein [Leucobacter weissii]
MTANTGAHIGAASTSEQLTAEFVAAVRDRLSDLSAEELDELLDGLQADLADRLSDGGELGDPDSYAEELRQAAGLPPRRQTGEPTRRTLRDVADAAESGLRNWLEGTKLRRGVRDFLLSLRPLWWVLRGVALAGIAVFVTGSTVPSYGVEIPDPSLWTLFLLVLGIVLSVQWGRGRWAPNRWLVALRRVAGAVAVLVLLVWPPMLASWVNQMIYVQQYGQEAEYFDSSWGLTSDGEQIRNIFAYDCTGAPLDGVQLFTESGDPLTTLQGGEAPWYEDDESGTGEASLALNQLADTASRGGGWNVFPLWETSIRGYDSVGEPVADAPAQPRPPFTRASGLAEDCGTATGATADADADEGSSSGSASSAEGARNPDATEDGR